MFEFDGLAVDFENMYIMTTLRWRFRFFKKNGYHFKSSWGFWHQIIFTKGGVCFWDDQKKQWVSPTRNSETNRMITEAYLTWASEKSVLNDT